jgi:hypothetical protein
MEFSDLQISVTALREVEHLTAHHSEKTGLLIKAITLFRQVNSAERFGHNLYGFQKETSQYNHILITFPATFRTMKEIIPCDAVSHILT